MVNEAPAPAPTRPPKPFRRWLRRIGLGLIALVAVVVAAGGIYVYVQASAYDESVDKVYAIPPLALVRSSDPAVIARGKHLTESVVDCTSCHGPDLGGGKATEAGPVGTMTPPNITNVLPAYTDGELARLIRHAVKKDGRTARFMPMNEVNWVSDADVVAAISYLRTMPPVDRASGTTTIKILGKIFDRKGLIPIDSARRIDHEHIELGPPPSPTVEYGRFIGRSCSGCHGEHMSGGPMIPGAPTGLPVPLNLTPHKTGLEGWTFADFERLADTGVRKNGTKLAEFMPIGAIAHMDDVERRALWAYLQSLPPAPFGGR